MSVFYKLRQDKREDSKTYGKWYARTYMIETVDTKMLSERIQRNCTAKASDVNAVLTELVEVMRDELQASRRVKLDGFGSFNIGLSSKGADNLKDFSVAKNVKSLHVLFMPELHISPDKTRTKTFLTGTVLKQYSGQDLPDGSNTPDPVNP